MDNPKNVVWIIRFNKDKIQHGRWFELEPILIRFPPNPKTKLIDFKISFYFDEPGKINEQHLLIKLNLN